VNTLYAVVIRVVCLSVNHSQIFYRNDWTNRAGFWLGGFLLYILHCFERKSGYFQNEGTSLWNFVPGFGLRKIESCRGIECQRREQRAPKAQRHRLQRDRTIAASRSIFLILWVRGVHTTTTFTLFVRVYAMALCLSVCLTVCPSVTKRIEPFLHKVYPRLILHCNGMEFG